MSTLIGTAGADILNVRGATYDTAEGLAGNDTYIVDYDDTVVEGVDGGDDTVELHLTSVAQGANWRAPDNVENLVVVAFPTATAGNDQANRLSGSGVHIMGLGGDDVLTNNGFSASILEGDDGNDLLVSASFKNQYGNDLLIGGRGDDSYVVYQGDTIIELTNQGHDTVTAYSNFTLPDNVEDLYAAMDGIALTGNSGANRIVGTNNTWGMRGMGGDDWLSGITTSADGGDGIDTFSYADRTQGVGMDLLRNTYFINIENLEGSNYADTFIGTNFDNVLQGRGGNDSLDGQGGNDTLEGGDGDDYLNGGLGDDMLNGGDGIDTADYGLATSSLTIDLNLTTAQNLGAAGVDTLLSIENVIGGAVDDTITGNAADNRFDGGEGDDVLNGGGGVDTAIYARSTGTVWVDLSITGRQNTQTQGYDTLVSIENLIGSNYNDVLLGDAQANRIDGGAGQDYMAGGAGDDTYLVDNSGDNPIEIDGNGYDTVISRVSYALNAGLEALILEDGVAGVGNGLDNTLTGNVLANDLQGGGGSDTLWGLAGNDKLYGQAGLDFLYGGDGDDYLDGGDTTDGLFGGAGADTLIGGAGQDWLEGGAGDDRYIVDDAGDNIVEQAGGGNDTVYAYVSMTLSDNVETLWLVGTGALNGVGSDQANSLNGNDDANDLMGRGGNDSIAGYGGDDHLAGNDGADLLDGAAGADWLDGGTGDDVLRGGDGNDVLVGGEGADQMTGGLGDDVYVVDSVGDQIIEVAGQGVENVYSSISLTLVPNVENVWLTGAAAIDGTGNSLANGLVGNDAANVLTGLGGDDFLVGYGGDDQLFGGFERDFLDGGAGDDLLVGGQGGDRLYGREGADTFRFDSVADSRFNGANDDRDAIMDFQVGVDKVDLRPLHAGGSDTFSLVPDSSGTAQLIHVDLGGDGTIDMEIVLFNVTNATSADILW